MVSNWNDTTWPVDYAAPVEADKLVWYPVCRIVRAYLIEQTVGVAYDSGTDWSICTAEQLDLPENLITIYDEASNIRSRSLASGNQNDPVISIHVRSILQDVGVYKAKRIQHVLDKISGWSWAGVGDGTFDQAIVVNSSERQRGVFPLGRDENNLWAFNMEYSLVIRNIT